MKALPFPRDVRSWKHRSHRDEHLCHRGIAKATHRTKHAAQPYSDTGSPHTHQRPQNMWHCQSRVKPEVGGLLPGLSENTLQQTCEERHEWESNACTLNGVTLVLLPIIISESDRKLLDLIWSKVWNLEVTERLLTQKLHEEGMVNLVGTGGEAHGERGLQGLVWTWVEKGRREKVGWCKWSSVKAMADV